MKKHLFWAIFSFAFIFYTVAMALWAASFWAKAFFITFAAVHLIIGAFRLWMAGESYRTERSKP